MKLNEKTTNIKDDQYEYNINIIKNNIKNINILMSEFNKIPDSIKSEFISLYSKNILIFNKKNDSKDVILIQDLFNTIINA